MSRLTCVDATPRDPLHHYDVLDTDPCGCSICRAWRSARAIAAGVARGRPDHPLTCNCPECVPTRRARYQLQALNTRRDLWIEASYHASLNRYGPHFMEWLGTDTVDVRRRYGWWANEASRFPIAWWFERFEKAVRSGVTTVTGAVSGAFDFTAHYLDEEPEGGGLASMSSLFADEIAYEAL